MKNSTCNICGELSDFLLDMEFFEYFSENKYLGRSAGYICNKCILEKSKPRKLYHVSFDTKIIKEFRPRIPRNRHSREDDAFKRICLSDSIEGCLSASPSGGRHLENICWGDSSFLIRVYEFDIKHVNLKNIIPPEYLYQQDLVRDAYTNNEYWAINQNLIPSKTYLLKLRHYDEGWPDDISYENYIKGLSFEKFLWEDVIEGFLTEIYNVKYEVVPEERKCNHFDFNHKIINISKENVINVEKDIKKIFPNKSTWVKIREGLEGELRIIGKVYTEGVGIFDRNDIIDFTNLELTKGEIIDNC